MNEQIENIKEKISRRLPDLVISRLPLNTFKRFKELASDDEFCGDYGMLLRDLIKVYDGMVPSVLGDVIASVEALAERVANMNKPEETKPEKIRRMMDGRKAPGQG